MTVTQQNIATPLPIPTNTRGPENPPLCTGLVQDNMISFTV